MRASKRVRVRDRLGKNEFLAAGARLPREKMSFWQRVRDFMEYKYDVHRSPSGHVAQFQELPESIRANIAMAAYALPLRPSPT